MKEYWLKEIESIPASKIKSFVSLSIFHKFWSSPIYGI